MSMRCWAAVSLMWIGTGLAQVSSHGQVPAPSRFEYTRTLWRISDGLLEDTVQAIVESSAGALWIGTTGGLTRFDGSHMTVPTQAQSLLAKSIFTLTLGRDGSLWAGTEGGGLLRVRKSGVNAYSVREGLTDGFVRKVLEDSRGRLWVGTDDGLFVMNRLAAAKERLRRVDVGAIAPLAVHAITEDHEGRIWVGGSRLIAVNPDGTEREFALHVAYS